MSQEMDPVPFLNPTSSSRKAAPRLQTASGNYVASVRKPTAVTHSCCGNFTGPNELNLVICKGTLVSIYLVTENRSEHLRDFPMFGRVVFMELALVHGLKNNRLFIATEIDRLYMFDWDVNASNVIAAQTMIFPPTLKEFARENHPPYEYLEFLQGGTICPRGEKVVLYHRQNQLRIIYLDPSGHGKTLYRLHQSRKILDVKFLKTFLLPPLALLCMGHDGYFHCGIYEVTDNDIVPKRLLQPNHSIEPTLLIPDHSSILIIGKHGIIYFDLNDTKTMFTGHIDIQAYGRVVGHNNFQRSRYLLGGHDGHLSLIETEEGRFSRLRLRPLGKTSVASSISYLYDDVVFVGSRYADSQLVKIHQLQEPHLDMDTPATQVLKVFSNSGPVIDFSVSNKPAGLRKLVMCCGTHEDSSLEAFSTAVGINEKGFSSTSLIRRIWSLKCTMLDKNHTFLVLAHEGDLPGNYWTSVLRVDVTGAISDHKMPGLDPHSITVCCHEAGDRQFVQVTEKYVRLIGTNDGLMRYEWSADSKILLASATNTQVLLTTMDRRLIYLRIENWKLVKGRTMEGYDASCLDISPIGTNSCQSKMAAVGIWLGRSVVLLSLPELEVLTVERFESHTPRCVLLCDFERVSYLLCVLQDGTLLTFKVNKDNGQLQEKNTMGLCGLGRTLRTFRSNGVAGVFFSTEDAPKLIFSKKKELKYNMLNLINIHDICSFQLIDIPEGLVIAKEDGFVICTLGDLEGHSKIPMINYGRRICHQEESESNVVLVEEKMQPAEGLRRHLVQLLDKELYTLSSFRLDEGELGLSVVSCSFTGADHNAYYCVGTSRDVPGEANIVQGRILVFRSRNEQFYLISQTQTNGAVKYLKALHGGLLGIVANDIHYFEWQPHGGGGQLHENPNLPGIDFLDIEERFALISSIIQKYELHDDSDIEIEPRLRTRLTAIHLLQGDSLLYSDWFYNILSSEGFGQGGIPEYVGRWHSGEFITQIKAGTLARMSDEDYAQFPSSMFSTVSGAIGVIVSPPPEAYRLLHRLERWMRRRTRGIGCSGEMFPRRCLELAGFRDNTEFVDGDFIQTFLSLALTDQKYIAKNMKVTLSKLKGIVEYVTHFH